MLGSQIVGPFHLGRGRPGGGWILDEPELHLGAGVLAPLWLPEGGPAAP